MKHYGVYIAGAKRCSESTEQLRLCHRWGSASGASEDEDSDSDSDDETAEDACQVFKQQFRECGGATQKGDPDPACLVPDQLPSIVWLPPLQSGTSSSTPPKPMAWAGFHDWADLKAVLDKVDAISKTLQLQRYEAAPQQELLSGQDNSEVGLGNAQPDESVP